MLASWHELLQTADPTLSLTELINVFDAAFISWGRHAATVTEVDLIHTFTKAPNHENRRVLGLPNSPAERADTTLHQCRNWVRDWEKWGPTADELLTEQSSHLLLGTVPVAAAGRQARSGPPVRRDGSRARFPSPRPSPDEKPWGSYGTSPHLRCVITPPSVWPAYEGPPGGPSSPHSPFSDSEGSCLHSSSGFSYISTS